MAVFDLDVNTLRAAFCAGAANLEANKDWINELNVFPVPDGDTGTNMTLTLASAVNEVRGLINPDIQALGKAISSGSLRGARGNSGVIISQLCRGFAKGLKDVEVLDKAAVARAFITASETAYKAVMKPKEGTILTVARGIAEKTMELVETEMNMIEMFREVLIYGEEVLANTPELLPVLKEAGVVDSGGQGLIVFLKGAYAVITGEVSLEESLAEKAAPAEEEAEQEITADTLRPGYYIEFTVKGPSINDDIEASLKKYLANLGEEAMVISLGTTLKARVRTADPGLAIQKAVSCGTVSKVKLEATGEMIKTGKAALKAVSPSEVAKPELRTPAERPEKKKDFGFIAVAAGDGIEDIFMQLGADGVITGGQTMNPSAEDIAAEIEKVNADTVYILPNNKNIILAAELAQNLIEDKKIIVVPSKTIPQGISALISFNPALPEDDNTAAINEGIGLVKTGQITYAIRDTVIDGKEIHENDIISIGDHSTLLGVGTDTYAVAMDTVEALVDEDSSAICVYYGDQVLGEEAEKLREELVSKYPDCDIEVQRGGQPIYYYIISVE